MSTIALRKSGKNEDTIFITKEMDRDTKIENLIYTLNYPPSFRICLQMFNILFIREMRSPNFDEIIDTPEESGAEKEPISNQSCSVCYSLLDTVPSVVYTPCGHNMICSFCDKEISIDPLSNRCLICRTPIESRKQRILSYISSGKKKWIYESHRDESWWMFTPFTSLAISFARNEMKMNICIVSEGKFYVLIDFENMKQYVLKEHTLSTGENYYTALPGSSRNLKEITRGETPVIKGMSGIIF